MVHIEQILRKEMKKDLTLNIKARAMNVKQHVLLYSIWLYYTQTDQCIILQEQMLIIT